MDVSGVFTLEIGSARFRYELVVSWGCTGGSGIWHMLVPQSGGCFQLGPELSLVVSPPRCRPSPGGIGALLFRTMHYEDVIVLAHGPTDAGIGACGGSNAAASQSHEIR